MQAAKSYSLTSSRRTIAEGFDKSFWLKFSDIPWDPCSFVFLCNYLVIPSLVASHYRIEYNTLSQNNTVRHGGNVVAKYFCLVCLIYCMKLYFKTTAHTVVI